MTTSGQNSPISYTAVIAPPESPAEWDSAERRESAEDRRHYTFNTMKYQVLKPQRFTARRSGERSFPILDRFDSGLFTMAMLLLCLSITDSMFTLTLIANGGSEVNPFMNMLLGYSVWAFAGVKMILTAVPIILLVATCNIKLYGFVRARSILAAAVGMYSGLIVYEVALLSQI